MRVSGSVHRIACFWSGWALKYSYVFHLYWFFSFFFSRIFWSLLFGLAANFGIVLASYVVDFRSKQQLNTIFKNEFGVCMNLWQCLKWNIISHCFQTFQELEETAIKFGTPINVAHGCFLPYVVFLVGFYVYI